MTFYKSNFSRLKSGLFRTLVPVNLQKRIDVMRVRSTVGDSKALFIHIPKAAGTAIANMLYGKSIQHITAYAFRTYYPDDFDSKFTFSVMRSPYSRTLSSYNFVKAGGTRDVNVDFKKEYLGSAFDSFPAFLEEFLVHEENQRLDHSFRPQVEFITADGEIIVDYVGLMEDLDSTITVLNRNTGGDYELPKVKNKMKRSSVQDELTDHAKAVIDQIYPDDVSLYNRLISCPTDDSTLE